MEYAANLLCRNRINNASCKWRLSWFVTCVTESLCATHAIYLFVLDRSHICRLPACPAPASLLCLLFPRFDLVLLPCLSFPCLALPGLSCTLAPKSFFYHLLACLLASRHVLALACWLAIVLLPSLTCHFSIHNPGVLGLIDD